MATNLPLTIGVPHFSITFNNANKTLVFEDLIKTGYQNYGGYLNFKGLIKVTNRNGTILYQGTGYDETTPVWTTPDINGTTPTWTKAGIDIELTSAGLIVPGDYVIDYLCTTNGTTFVHVQKVYNFDYVSPVVVIDILADCRTSTLFTQDVTVVKNRINGIDFEPSSLSRVRSIERPIGSSFTPPADDTTTAIIDLGRTIGGGVTDATRLWTRVWQVNIDLTLSYSVATWDAYTWVVITDEITGEAFEDVRCDSAYCNLRQCMENAYALWVSSMKSAFGHASDLESKIVQLMWQWTIYEMKENCGTPNQEQITNLKKILGEISCDQCNFNEDDSSHPVYAIGTALGGGSISLPNGAWYLYTDGSTYSDLYYNSAIPLSWTYGNTIPSGWTFVTHLQGVPGVGTPGKDGKNGTSESILWNDIGVTATGSGTDVQTLKSFTTAAGTMGNDMDVLKVKALFKLALNDNGKAGGTTFGGDLLMDFFTDALIDAESDKVLLESEISRVTANSQFITSKCISNGLLSNDTPKQTVATKNLLASQIITAYGQNSVSNAGDVSCTQLEISYEGKISGAVSLGENFKAGYNTVVAGDEFTVTFLTPFADGIGDGYVVNIRVTDISGDSQTLNFVPGTQNEAGFHVVSPVSGRIDWTAQLPQS